MLLLWWLHLIPEKAEHLGSDHFHDPPSICFPSPFERELLYYSVHIRLILLLWRNAFCPHWIFSPTQDKWESWFSPEFSVLCFWSSLVISVHWHTLWRVYFFHILTMFSPLIHRLKRLGVWGVSLCTAPPVLFTCQDTILALLLCSPPIKMFVLSDSFLLSKY